MAVGVLRALHERGLRVPEDVSITAFGVLDASALPYSALTLIEGDTRQLGRLAVRRLLERVREPEASPVRVVLGVKVVERESVGPVPESQRLPG
jgi:LacI family transcriptional regulator